MAYQPNKLKQTGRLMPFCQKFLWIGSDASVRGRCMVAWPTVCKPTQLGSLGISDLKLQGFALQTPMAVVAKDGPRLGVERAADQDSP